MPLSLGTCLANSTHPFRVQRLRMIVTKYVQVTKNRYKLGRKGKKMSARIKMKGEKGGDT